MNRTSILDTLLTSVQNKEPLIGVSIGNGRSALQASQGGADFLLALNAGRFRMSGVASTAGMLPFSNSNEMVFDFATKEILPRVDSIPVLFGACAQDPTISHEDLLHKITVAGFQGVNNFPSVSLIDGRYREFLESDEAGFDLEVALLKKAHQQGLFTVAFAVTLQEAVSMASANVDVLCLHFGWTYIHRGREAELGPSIDEMIEKANRVFSAIKKINPSIIPMIYGGSVVRNAEMMERFYKETEVVGYIGGSVFEVMPVENSIKDATDRFKSINHVKELEQENQKLKQLIQQRAQRAVIGNSFVMQDLITKIKKIAPFDNNVLVLGESGTGKDLVVRALHYHSLRATAPLIKLNCAAIAKELIESELFGHEKGAFIGADKQHIGRFEAAHRGTLFLDNITELDLALQAKLLRVIQDKEFERVGGNDTIAIDVRIISTTNKDIQQELNAGRFREDLYYLLNVVTLQLPPLRLHKEDIPLYVSSFMDEINEKNSTRIILGTGVMEAIMTYDWPGNVRELKNVLERGTILSDGHVLDINCLPSTIHRVLPMDEAVNHIKNTSMILEKELIISELNKANWNQSKVANHLGITRRTLYNKIKKYEINKFDSK